MALKCPQRSIPFHSLCPRKIFFVTRSRILPVQECCISATASTATEDPTTSVVHADGERKGRGGWNRGKKTPQEVREKIRVSLKGRVPWNKGEKLSQKTREKMRLSKLGRQHSLASRRKMSISSTGKTHSPETMKLLSQKLSKVPKSVEHRRKISESQKKRHAINKALKTIEIAHKLAGPIYDDMKNSSSYPLSCLRQPISRKSLSREKKTRAEVFNMYKSLLREYRALQKELKPWMKAFEMKNSRKPHRGDVEATQITWLISNFKNYVLLRDKLFKDIPFLRNAMERAPDHQLKGTSSTLEATDKQDLSARSLHASYGDHRIEFNSQEERMEKVSSSEDVPDRVRRAMSAAMVYKKAKFSFSNEDGEDLEPTKEVQEAKAKALEAFRNLELKKTEQTTF